MSDQTAATPFRYILPMIYGVLFVLLFYSSYEDMLVWWESSDYNYCYLVPLIAGYLFWERRDALRLNSVPSLAGLIVVVFGIFLYLLGELGGHLFSVHISSWIIFVGLIWMHFGWDKLRAISFPVCILLAMFPLPSIVNTAITSKLKLFSSGLGAMILRGSGVAVFQDGNIIDLGFARMELVDACSGLRYFFPLVIVAILVAGLHRARYWQRILLVLSAAPISALSNALRIVAMGWLFPVLGQLILDGFWHELLGFVLFMFTILILLGELRLLLWLAPMGAEMPAQDDIDCARRMPRQRSMLPLAMAALGLLSVTAAVGRTIDFREQTPLAKPMSQFPMTIAEWQGMTSPLEQMYLDRLNLSDYLQASYVNKSGQTVGVYVGYYASQTKGVSSHSPEVCLPGSGWTFDDAGSALAAVGPAESMAEVRRVVMEKDGMKMLMYYWYAQRGRVLNNPFQLKWFNFVDALTKQRTDGALVRLITMVYEREKPEDAEARLQGFVRQIAPELNAHIPG